VQTINRIEEIFKSNPDFNSYQQNFVLRMATERLLGIVGEAVSKYDKIPGVPTLSFTPQIIGFRNIIVHDYAKVLDAVVWEIVYAHLPLLKAEADALLNE
jgi:uncharacterized protein with HEPN domain